MYSHWMKFVFLLLIVNALAATIERQQHERYDDNDEDNMNADNYDLTNPNHELRRNGRFYDFEDLLEKISQLWNKLHSIKANQDKRGEDDLQSYFLRKNSKHIVG